MNTIRRRDFLKAGTAATAVGFMGVSQTTSAQTLAGAASYAGNPNTPEKPWTLPQRPSAPVSIDIHTHWAPEEYMKLKAQFGQPDQSSPMNYDLPARAKQMDTQGVQTQVLTLGGFMPWDWVKPDQGMAIARAVNDAAIAAYNTVPGRFLFAIELPAADAAGSLKELNRVAGKPGLVAVHLPNSLAQREFLFDEAFAPVLARCEELHLPLLIHPADGEANWFAASRMNDKYSGPTGGGTASRFPGLTNQVGDPYEQGLTAAKLIVNGTLDKYPNLEVVLSHAGGTFPYIVGRIDFRGAGLLKLQHPMKDYIRRFYYDSLTYYPSTLQYLIDLAGSDRVVMGTDSMGPMAPRQAAGAPPAGDRPAAPQANRPAGAAGPHSVIDQLTISAADRDLILRGNLRRLFKLQS